MTAIAKGIDMALSEKLRAEFIAKARTDGVEAATKWLEIAKRSVPTGDEAREGAKAAARGEYERLRAVDPFGAAAYAARHPGVYEAPPAAPPPDARTVFANARATANGTPPTTDVTITPAAPPSITVGVK